MALILADFGEERGGGKGTEEKAKKSGLAAVTLNLRFQPRLPGSVVGEAIMRVGRQADKIT
jgi:hypothetical protein